MRYRIVIREIIFRLGTFLVQGLTTLVATAAILGTTALLRGYDRQAENRWREVQLDQRGALGSFESRLNTSLQGLGHNLTILPREQDPGEFFAAGHSSHAMPESFALRLATNRLKTITNPVPMLIQRIQWPERDQTIILSGIGAISENQSLTAADSRPAMPPGQVELGYLIHHRLAIAENETVVILGRSFIVRQCREAEGTIEDITIWMNLREAQDLLGKAGLIHGIVATGSARSLEPAETLLSPRDEILALLPDVQVLDETDTTRLRSELSSATRAVLVDRFRTLRAHARRVDLDRETTIYGMLGIILAVCTAGLIAVSWLNVQTRLPEIAVLRAFGAPTGTIGQLMMSRGFLSAGLGACLATGTMSATGPWLASAVFFGNNFTDLIRGWELAAVTAGVPLVSSLVVWPTILFALRRDPADILRHA